MKYLKYSLLVAGFFSAVAQAQYEGDGEEINFLEEPVQHQSMMEMQEVQMPRRTRVQKQPKTYIEDDRIASQADDSIKQLTNEIYKTNDAVINEINKSRISEESARRDKFMGRVQGLSTESQPEVTPVASAPVVVAPLESALEKEALESRLSALELNKKVESEESKQQTYFQALVGFTEVDAGNIKEDGSFGFGIGVRVKDRLLVDGNFVYSSYLKDYPYQTTIEQYSGVGNIRYQIFNGVLRPVVGASVAYNYRTFSDDQSFYGESATSNSIDWGLLGGVDVELTDSFSIGTEFRYMWNLTNRTDGSYPYYGTNEQPFDDFNYYVMSVSGRFIF